ncbi:MAG: transcriptional regulator [Pseudonocardiales bacterium]|nr:MAG: transcriptional regulator [Pseudonocardiales bacterium]
MSNADLAPVARLIGDPTRAVMLDALLAGRPLAAGELARLAGVTAQTASAHLGLLLDAGLIGVEKQGRHRYFRLAGEDVAGALEALALISPARPVRSLRQSQSARALGYARTCYDHLAGVAGVAVLDAMLDQEWLRTGEGGYDLTVTGAAAVEGLGLDVAALRERRRSFARPCLDWTERRPHLAGSVAAAMTATMIERGWFVRRRAGDRGLRVTESGIAGLAEVFGCRLTLAA